MSAATPPGAPVSDPVSDPVSGSASDSASTAASTPGVLPRLRSTLEGVPAYVAGKPAAPAPGLTPYKASSNENPYPPLPSVLEAVARAAADLNRYPDFAATAMTTAIAERFGVPRECLATGTGSVGLLAQLVQITCDPGDEVVLPWRSFEAYPITVGLAGARAVPVPLTAEARHDLPAMAAAITDRTRLVMLCSPNNPTGPALRREELERFLDEVPRDVLVVLDEAYREFVRDPEVPDGLAVREGRANVVVLRTFSKAYGLAGLRVGYAVAHPQVAAALRKAATPFGVSGVAQAAVVSSLQPEAARELDERVEALVAERARVLAGLRAQGWAVPDADGNFVWLPAGADSSRVAARLGERGLVVRPYGDDGVRVTVAEPEANDRLLEVAGELRAGSA
ncbi:histidinol-phosphate aminotransferase [Kineococcus xinjiangensis]|uniref:Aromatic amino acid aminotransferase n=1 Tax=Kineococcus xinjiangensis TaxID=512762 RepID=A0A2S6IV32_9ACTN|nr:histidinol-phosphate transaminase [Kineococcus xinjiangensis]PPK98121.1 histidinol-phosphate aminotransferase [Kineococcus xinjiangensis]